MSMESNSHNNTLYDNAVCAGLCMTCLTFTVWFWVRAKWSRHMSKNKLTLKPYLFFMAFFTITSTKDFIVWVNYIDGWFPSLASAYIFLVLDFAKNTCVYLALGF